MLQSRGEPISEELEQKILKHSAYIVPGQGDLSLSKVDHELLHN